MRLNRGGVETIVARLEADDPLPPEERSEPKRSSIVETLYRTHYTRLLNFFRRRGRRDTAQDLVQQAFCRLASLKDEQLEAIASPEAYLIRTSGNLMRDEARTASRRSTHLHLCDGDVPLPAHDLIAGVEARDALRRIEAALMRLKPRTREIFLAHRIDGYSYAEIAARTDLSIKTVEMHMTRAIAYLDRHRRS